MKGNNENPDDAFREWLLETHDSGMATDDICHLSGRLDFETRMVLRKALEGAYYADSDYGLP